MVRTAESTVKDTEVAKTEPQAPYTAFASGFKHKLTYYKRTLPNIKQHLVQLDALVDQVFIPAITDGQLCSPDERLLLSSPAKKGGLTIPIFSVTADSEFSRSRAATEKLREHISNQDGTEQVDSELLKHSKRDIVKAREEHNEAILEQLPANVSPEQLRANNLATLTGPSSWLTTLPRKSENHNLNKREFYHSLSLRYHWTQKYLPSVCPRDKRFDVDHAMSCMKSGFVHKGMTKCEICSQHCSSMDVRMSRSNHTCRP